MEFTRQQTQNVMLGRLSRPRPRQPLRRCVLNQLLIVGGATKGKKIKAKRTERKALIKIKLAQCSGLTTWQRNIRCDVVCGQGHQSALVSYLQSVGVRIRGLSRETPPIDPL